MRRLTGWVAAVALVAAAALGTFVAAPASAHDYLVDSSPKAGSTQTTPINKVRLTFDDVVLDLAKSGPGALLQVTGPNGKATHFETGCPTISGRQVSVPVSLGKSGKYLVTWQIVSADGHVVSDSIQFTYAPPAGTKTSAGASASPCKGAGAAATAAPTAGAGTAEGTVNSGAIVIVVVIAAGIVVLALIAVVVILLTRRRGGASDHADDEEDEPVDPDED